jgi:hypothetical protein
MAEYDRIWKSSIGIRSFLLDPAKSARRNPATATEIRLPLPDLGCICWTLIFIFRNFFEQAKRRKIFYDENYFTSKQTEH